MFIFHEQLFLFLILVFKNLLHINLNVGFVAVAMTEDQPESGDVTDSPLNSLAEGKQEPGSVQSSDSEFY